jgi:hypothetical protein
MQEKLQMKAFLVDDTLSASLVDDRTFLSRLRPFRLEQTLSQSSRRMILSSASACQVASIKSHRRHDHENGNGSTEGKVEEGEERGAGLEEGRIPVHSSDLLQLMRHRSINLCKGLYTGESSVLHEREDVLLLTLLQLQALT